MLSPRGDGDLLERPRRRAAKRGMSVRDHVVRTLLRDDFDERFQAAAEEAERFYGVSGTVLRGDRSRGPAAPRLRSDPGPASGRRR
ncbi:hypothetical protein GCM10020295_46910 [Streptomyces cinereospinus]